MSVTTLQWARVEYQPDLQKPEKTPVPLGVLVLYRAHDVRAVVVLGREPRKDALSSELLGVGKLGLSQLVGWVGALAKDAQDAAMESPNPVAALASRWRWNLYVTDPENIKFDVPDTQSEGEFRAALLAHAKRLYESHVKERFPIPELPQFPDRERQTRAGRRVEWVPREVESMALAP